MDFVGNQVRELQYIYLPHRHSLIDLFACTPIVKYLLTVVGKSGLVEQIPPHIIPQVIGKGGSMLQALKDLGDARLGVGQNGRVWIDGEQDGMRDIRSALKLIRDTAHLPGLRERIDALGE